MVIGGALFYLVTSTLTIGAFFMLIELVERLRDPGADVLAVTMELYGDIDEDELHDEQDVGIAIPATIAILGGSFVGCALLLSGLPPMAGFIAKFAMLTGMLNAGPSAVANDAIAPSAFVLAALLLLSGLAAVIAMTRTGITTFWARLDSSVPRVAADRGDARRHASPVLSRPLFRWRPDHALHGGDRSDAPGSADLCAVCLDGPGCPVTARGGRFMSRVLPYPVLALALILLWLLLNQSLSPGHRAAGYAHRHRRHMGVRRTATRKAPDPPAGLDSPARGLCHR